MNTVIIKDGKLTATKEPVKKNGKAKKYAYSVNEYDSLVKLAKTAGLDIGTTPASKTKAVNSVTRAVLEEFITTQNKPKNEK